MAILGTKCDGSSETHIRCQLWGPYTVISAGDHIRLAVLGTTCHGNSGEHMRLHFWHSHAMEVLGTIYEWQFWGTHAISILGITRYIVAGYHIRMAVLGNTCNLNSGDHTLYFCWGPHMMEVLGTTCDVISGGHMQCQFWGPSRILV